MRLVEIASIKIGDRQRKEFKQPDIDALKRSIMSKGLMHPIVLTNDNILVAGERRLRAMTQLYEEGLFFSCDGNSIASGLIPTIGITDLTMADLQEAELEENILRVPLGYLEEVEAKAKIHQLRCEQNPRQTVIDTAREIATITSGSIDQERKVLAQSLIIVQHKDDPRVTRAKSRQEAFKAVLDKRENQWQGSLAKQENVLNQSHTIIHGDCLVELPKLPGGQIAAIICDPPYGIDADSQGKESNHYYDDSPETALAVCEAILREGFRVTKPRAILFMFCDIENFNHLKTYAAQQAWTVWKNPLIWYKGNSGHAPWGRAGFRKTYEALLFAVKGQAELHHFGEDDVIKIAKTTRGDRTHAAEKPYELLRKLVYLSALPGETILDPCGGSGSIIPAARKGSCRTIVIERDETSYHQCLARLNAELPTEDEANSKHGTTEDYLSLLKEEN